jgi:hypothetical protein
MTDGERRALEVVARLEDILRHGGTSLAPAADAFYSLTREGYADVFAAAAEHAEQTQRAAATDGP